MVVSGIQATSAQATQTLTVEGVEFTWPDQVYAPQSLEESTNAFLEVSYVNKSGSDFYYVGYSMNDPSGAPFPVFNIKVGVKNSTSGVLPGKMSFMSFLNFTGPGSYPITLCTLKTLGGGTTEIAIIALGGIVCDESIRVAGDEFNLDILEYMRREHNLLIGERTAEKIKIHIGSALQELDTPPEDYAVFGRDLMTGIPKQIIVSYSEIARALDKSIMKVEEAVLRALEQSPPELSADILSNGIWLTGGGALLRGLDKRISAKTKLRVHIAEDPLRAVVRGTGTALKNIGRFKFLMTA